MFSVRVVSSPLPQCESRSEAARDALVAAEEWWAALAADPLGRASEEKCAAEGSARGRLFARSAEHLVDGRACRFRSVGHGRRWASVGDCGMVRIAVMCCGLTRKEVEVAHVDVGRYLDE